MAKLTENNTETLFDEIGTVSGSLQQLTEAIEAAVGEDVDFDFATWKEEARYIADHARTILAELAEIELNG